MFSYLCRRFSSLNQDFPINPFWATRGAKWPISIYSSAFQTSRCPTFVPASFFSFGAPCKFLGYTNRGEELSYGRESLWRKDLFRVRHLRRCSRSLQGRGKLYGNIHKINKAYKNLSKNLHKEVIPMKAYRTVEKSFMISYIDVL